MTDYYYIEFPVTVICRVRADNEAKAFKQFRKDFTKTRMIDFLENSALRCEIPKTIDDVEISTKHPSAI